jgi:SAM-dependent methyltransferase
VSGPPVKDLTCPICGGRRLESAGSAAGQFAKRSFSLAHCLDCRFSFVTDPWTEYEAIYSEAYYHGRGADPHVDYVFELEHPETTVRSYEWRGLLRAVRSLAPVGARTRWLDFGCGNGGLVRWAREHGVDNVVGHETGWIASRAQARGIPMLSAADLARESSTFDLITAIEVLEHVVDPIDVLRQIAQLLKPGGVLFLTTGNANPYRNRLPEWRYVIPEIHVSFFEPQTLGLAMQTAGLNPVYPGFVDGFDQIIRFKILKALGVRRRAFWEQAVPWPLVSRLVDSRLALSAHPAGRRAAARTA